MMIDLRPIQREVVDSDEPHLVVVAGAGAGKTSVLVQRYLRFIRMGVSPSSILSITFTRKAAAEMKSRIVATLRAEGLFEAARAAETGPIQTVHSFCDRLLRENAIAAGLDPEFEILGEAAKAELRERAIQAAMGDPPEDESVRSLLHELAGTPSNNPYSGRQSIHGRLEEALLRFIEEARGSGMNRGDLLELYQSADTTLAHWQSTLHNYLRDELHIQPPVDAFDRLELQRALKEAGKSRVTWAKSVLDKEALERSASLTSGLVLLGCEAWRILENAMTARQALDFSALETYAVRLVENSAELQRRIANEFKVMMVDEAQDLNTQQYRLLNGLPVPQRLFVGDPYQSIYGWRQADYRLFRGLADKGPRCDLNENHRSAKGILDFVQLLFGRIWGNDKAFIPMVKPGAPVPPPDFLDQEPPACDDVEIWRNPQESITYVANRIAEMKRDIGNEPSVAVLVRSGTYANRLLPELERRGLPARIVGGTDRYYTRLEVRDVANCLRALAEPHNDFALLATLRSPIVGLSLDAIALLGLVKPVISGLATFQSPVPEDQLKIQRFLDWFLPLSTKADRIPACELLGEVFAVSGYWEALGERTRALPMLANVRKLLKLAAEAPEQDALTFAERIRDIQRMNHKEGDAPAETVQKGEITILTVFKAKGLEWDYVIVPDLYKESNRAEDVEIDSALNLVTTSFEGQATMPHAFAKFLRTESRDAETLRVLYVALTRAKLRLIVAADTKAKAGSMAKVIAENVSLDRNPPKGIKIVQPE